MFVINSCRTKYQLASVTGEQCWPLDQHQGPTMWYVNSLQFSYFHIGLISKCKINLNPNWNFTWCVQPTLLSPRLGTIIVYCSLIGFYAMQLSTSAVVLFFFETLDHFLCCSSFDRQHLEIKSMLAEYAVNEALVAENDRLRCELATLKSSPFVAHFENWAPAPIFCCLCVRPTGSVPLPVFNKKIKCRTSSV